MSPVRVDHIIYAVDDLDAAGRRLYEESGLASIEGGRHPAWGTANRIVPLETAYVELVTVVDRDVAACSDFGRPVMDAIAAGRHLVGWAVATDDLGVISRRLGLEVSRGARTRPDGTTLSWQLAGVARALTTGALPMFIEWGGSAWTCAEIKTTLRAGCTATRRTVTRSSRPVWELARRMPSI